MKEFFYKKKDTRFHRLNPFLKIAAVLAIMVPALILSDLLILLFLLAITLLISLEAKVAHGLLFYLRISAWVGIFILLLNLLFFQGGSSVLFEAQLGIPYLENLRITFESLLFGITMALRLSVVMAAFAIASLTISPEEAMLMLSKLKVPGKTVFMTSLSARFVPMLLEDAETLEQVQKTRGAKLKGIRGKGPILIPLLSSSLERSVSVAEAMEARGFDGRFRFDD